MNFIEKKKDGEIRSILIRNFDNDKYAWSVAHKELSELITELIQQALKEQAEQVVAEERVRIEKEVTEQFKYGYEHDNYDMRGVDWQKIIHPETIYKTL